MMNALWQDLRYGMRILRKNQTFALVAILALALGTGANAGIFELVNALRLRARPVAKPQELVSIGIDQHGKGRVGRGYGARSIFTEPLWQEIRTQQQAFSSLFAWESTRWDLSTEGEALALGVSKLFASVLVIVDTFDPAGYAFGTLVVLAACLGAAWAPSRRAARVDPMVALRYE